MQKVFFSIMLLFIWKISFSQNSERDIAFNLSNYSFAYNFEMNKGTNASGLTMTLNTNGKFMLQFGLLIDYRKYLFYDGLASNHYATYHSNIFLPLLGHYNYHQSGKTRLFLTSGVIIGGQNTISLDDQVMTLGIMNLMIGTGFTFPCLDWLNINLFPNIRYNTRYFFPGLSIDISFLFKSKSLKSEKFE